jgi:hypothetical protein
LISLAKQDPSQPSQKDLKKSKSKGVKYKKNIPRPAKKSQSKGRVDSNDESLKKFEDYLLGKKECIKRSSSICFVPEQPSQQEVSHTF